jgi:hypothetical protein
MTCTKKNCQCSNASIAAAMSVPVAENSAATNADSAVTVKPRTSSDEDGQTQWGE